MPELPEIMNLAQQMHAALVGKTIGAIEVLQPKSLNVPEAAFIDYLKAANIRSVTARGKWLFVETTQGWLLLNLGMGGEIRLCTRQTLPEKVRCIFDFEDGHCLAVNFWWFGYIHYAPLDDLDSHEMTAKLGPSALDMDAAALSTLLAGRRGRIKNYLLDQKFIAGIGNFYAHDILFRARLHPLRPANSLTDEEIAALAQAIQSGLRPSLEQGGSFYEQDLYGNKGGYTMDDVLIAYKEGGSCPVCATPIVKLRTGSTNSFICPNCQPAPA